MEGYKLKRRKLSQLQMHYLQQAKVIPFDRNIKKEEQRKNKWLSKGKKNKERVETLLSYIKQNIRLLSFTNLQLHTMSTFLSFLLLHLFL